MDSFTFSMASVFSAFQSENNHKQQKREGQYGSSAYVIPTTGVLNQEY